MASLELPGRCVAWLFVLAFVAATTPNASASTTTASLYRVAWSVYLESDTHDEVIDRCSKYINWANLTSDDVEVSKKGMETWVSEHSLYTEGGRYGDIFGLFDCQPSCSYGTKLDYNSMIPEDIEMRLTLDTWSQWTSISSNTQPDDDWSTEMEKERKEEALAFNDMLAGYEYKWSIENGMLVYSVRDAETQIDIPFRTAYETEHSKGTLEYYDLAAALAINLQYNVNPESQLDSDIASLAGLAFPSNWLQDKPTWGCECNKCCYLPHFTKYRGLDWYGHSDPDQNFINPFNLTTKSFMPPMWKSEWKDSFDAVMKDSYNNAFDKKVAADEGLYFAYCPNDGGKESESPNAGVKESETSGALKGPHTLYGLTLILPLQWFTLMHRFHL